MSDPIKDLENFHAEGIPVNPLAPSEVRRRGDRMRHRRNAGAAVAGIAAVALVATPLALFLGGDERSDAPPANPSTPATGITTTEGPGRTYVTEIPSAFPLALEIDRQEDGTTPTAHPEDKGAPLPVPCAPDTTSLAGSVDSLGVRATYPAEGSDARSLKTFATARAAADALEEVRRAAAGCATEPLPDGAIGSYVWTLGDLELGDDGFTLVQTYDTGLGGAIYQAVRVGNAVLVTEAGGEWELTSTVPVGVEERTALGERLVQEMCVFAEHPCVVQGEPAGRPATTVPAGFPLSSQLAGEVDTSRGVSVVACDRTLWPVAGFADRMRVRASDEMTSEGRELVVFADAAKAVAAMDRLRTGLAECPTQVNEQDPTSSPEQAWTMHEADTGFEDSLTFSLTYTDGGLGGGVWQFTRVGNAILALDLDAEINLDAAPYTIDRFSAVTGELTPEMCVFTVAGC